MTSRVHRPFLFTALAACGLALSACQSDKHTMVEPAPDSKVVCKECYNEIYKVTHSTEYLRGATYQEAHTRHVCPDCKTEMSIYTENGVTKLKCGKCAPESLACDKCLPPKGWTPPKPADEPAAK
ncbi:MAG: hypothetical protein WC718_01955 [Phycisphaerales bacterium]